MLAAACADVTAMSAFINPLLCIRFEYEMNGKKEIKKKKKKKKTRI
jgi:hypothetical protein